MSTCFSWPICDFWTVAFCTQAAAGLGNVKHMPPEKNIAMDKGDTGRHRLGQRCSRIQRPSGSMCHLALQALRWCRGSPCSKSSKGLVILLVQGSALHILHSILRVFIIHDVKLAKVIRSVRMGPVLIMGLSCPHLH